MTQPSEKTVELYKHHYDNMIRAILIALVQLDRHQYDKVELTLVSALPCPAIFVCRLKASNHERPSRTRSARHQ